MWLCVLRVVCVFGVAWVFVGWYGVDVCVCVVFFPVMFVVCVGCVFCVW